MLTDVFESAARMQALRAGPSGSLLEGFGGVGPEPLRPDHDAQTSPSGRALCALGGPHRHPGHRTDRASAGAISSAPRAAWAMPTLRPYLPGADPLQRAPLSHPRARRERRRGAAAASAAYCRVLAVDAAAARDVCEHRRQLRRAHPPAPDASRRRAGLVGCPQPATSLCWREAGRAGGRLPRNAPPRFGCFSGF